MKGEEYKIYDKRMLLNVDTVKYMVNLGFSITNYELEFDMSDLLVNNKTKYANKFKQLWNYILTPKYISLFQRINVNKIIFYYALLGDSSDNIPGVKGIKIFNI